MSLRRDEGGIYLCFLLRPVGFCFSKILHLCHLGVTKSACPTAAEKCLSTAICPYSRWRSQPLSRVSRKQRYNTLDFPRESRVPREEVSPLDSPYIFGAWSANTAKTQSEHLAPKILTALRFCTHRTVELLLLVWKIFSNILQATIKYRAQFI